MDVLVSAVGDRWAVLRAREGVPLARFDLLDEAVAYGRMLADACGAAVVVHPAPEHEPPAPSRPRRRSS